MKFKDLSLRVKVLMGGLIPLVFLVGMVIVTIVNINAMIKSNEWVEHTHKVLEKATHILNSAVDMETGMRGFLLSGKDEFLNPYKTGETLTYETIKALQGIVSDNPGQVKRLGEVNSILKEWQINVTEPIIELRRNVGKTKTMNDIAALVGEARGKQYFDKFRQLMAEFKSEEEKLMVVRQENNSKRVRSTIITVSLCAITAIIIGILLSLGITRSVMDQLGSDPSEIAEIANSIASGNMAIRYDDDEKKNTGVYASMKHMTGNLSAMIRDIQNSAQTLDSSSGELSVVSEQMASNAEQTSERSFSVAAASEEMSTNMNSVVAATEQTTSNIQTIASAIEEMTSTINEIAQNTANGSATTSEAVKTAKIVSGKVDELGKAASEINKVTDTIADISAQTNLLALNATIEAARAGDAGRGFAVVAGEIKTLAQQTAEATSEISSRINGIQTTTSESVVAIQSIVEIINEINNIVTSVAIAIEEQSATTQEISNNVNQAAVGVQEVSDNINQTSSVVEEVNTDINRVSHTADEMKTGGVQVKSSAANLSELAKNLSEMVEQFTI